MKNQIKKLIAEHVKRMRRQMSWTGENDVVVEKIMKIIEKKAWLVLHFMGILRGNERYNN